MSQRRNLCNLIRLKGNSKVNTPLSISYMHVYNLYILYG